jgi:hypothetical protein
LLGADPRHVVTTGDFVEVLWFQGFTEYLQAAK